MFSVRATELNLRSTPEAFPDLRNRIAVIPNGSKLLKTEARNLVILLCFTLIKPLKDG